MAILFSLILVPLVGSASLAVDWVLAMQTEARLQRALDAAALAAGLAAENRDPLVEARAYFDANLGDRVDSLIVHTFALATDPDTGFTTLEVAVEAPTFFLSMLGQRSISMQVETAVNLQRPATELVLVLDVTGSMARDGMIDTMKLAAKELVEIVFDGEAYRPDLHVGLVPYVATVNIGRHRGDWLRPDDAVRSSAYFRDHWRGCILARAHGLDETDAPPAEGGFSSYHWPGNRTHVNIWPAIVESFDTARRGLNKGPNLGCPNAITSLQSDRGAILAAIDALYLDTDFSGTLGNIGLVWGWRVLSPRWRGLWGGATPNTHPLPDDRRQVEKVVVMLTDGNNFITENVRLDEHGQPISNGQGGWSRMPDLNAYDTYALLGTSTRDAALTEVNNRLQRTCAAMKEQGIHLFTITFGANLSNTTRQLYSDCASRLDHYFHAPLNSQLRLAFQDIGDRVARLRVVR